MNSRSPQAIAPLAPEDGRIRPIQRSSSLAEQAYEVLRRATRSGALVPGRVYSEQDVAEMLGISRTPVREALVELEHEGVVTKVRQKGFRLRELTDDEREEAYALRTLIESYVVGRLARGATADDIHTLREIVARQEAAIGNIIEVVEAGEVFHLEMAARVGPVWTAQIVEMLRGILWLSGLDAISQPGRQEEDVAEHRRVVEAVAAHDRRAAQRALVDHLEATARAGRLGRGVRTADSEESGWGRSLS